MSTSSNASSNTFSFLRKEEEVYLHGQKSWKGKLLPVVVQVPDGFIGQGGSKKWVQLGQNCYQPADGQILRELGSIQVCNRTVEL